LLNVASSFVNNGMGYSQKNRGINSAGELMAGATSMDCSSFVAMVVNKAYGIPANVFGATTTAQFSFLYSNATEVPKGQEQPGDFVTYWASSKFPANHIAIVSKKGHQIHMSSSKHVNNGKGGIVEGRIQWSGRRPVKVYRIDLSKVSKTKVLSKMPSIGNVANKTVIPGVGVVPNGGNVINTMNQTLENLETKVYNIQEHLLNKEEKENKDKNGFFGLLPTPNCSI
jgi:hypothetical protein